MVLLPSREKRGGGVRGISRFIEAGWSGSRIGSDFLKSLRKTMECFSTSGERYIFSHFGVSRMMFGESKVKLAMKIMGERERDKLFL